MLAVDAENNQAEDSSDNTFTIVFVNNPPNVPRDIFPGDEAVDIPIDTILSWIGGDPDFGDSITYDVYFGTSATPPLVSHGQIESIYQPQELAYHRFYFWKVVATDNYGLSSSSPTMSFLTETEPIPQSPSDLSATSVSSDQVDLSWIDTSENEIGFRIERKTESSSSSVSISQALPDEDYMLIDLVPGDSASFSDINLMSDTIYSYRVCAFGSTGDSTYIEAGVTTLPPVNNPPYEPGSPSPINGSTNVSVDTDISWTGGDPDTDDTVTYDIYFGTDQIPPLFASDQTQTTYDVGTLAYNTSYYWKIVAEDNIGVSTEGPEWSFTTECNTPGIPALPSPANSSTMVFVDADLDWSNCANASLYDVYFGTSATPTYLGNTSNSSYQLPQLNNSTKYYWRVVAKNGCGSTNGSIWSFTTIASGQNWSVPMNASTPNEGSNPNLAFGINSSATDGFDSGIDLPHPPPAPGNTLDAYFHSDDIFDQLDEDFRAPNASIQWILHAVSDVDDITLTWDAGAIPPDTALYMNTGADVIDMKQQNSVVLPPGSYDIIISQGEVEIELSLKTGWNMVSVPVTPIDSSRSAVFPGAAAVYTWDPISKSYDPIASGDAITHDKGYWVAVTGDSVFHVFGLSVYNWTTDITKGWNMIGSVIEDVAFTSPEDNPDGSVEAFAYRWDPVGRCYVYTQSIASMQGSWIAATQNCDLTLGIVTP